MGKVKIQVVEDEIVIADNICGILEKLGYEVLEPVINYSEAIEQLEEERPDLSLLDIQLAGSKDGIDLAWKIKEDYDIPFIFLTSNADPRTVGRAKELSPPAYLVKPFNKDDLYTSIEMALHNYGARINPKREQAEDNVIIKDSFFIKDKNLYHKVKFSDILFIKSEHVYVELYTQSGKKHLIRTTMNDFVESLPKNFFRTHRSYTINLNYLDTINSRYVIISNLEIPIGKNYRDDLMQQISIR
ncbi:MAG: response regulator [Flavobacteriales bacterium]|nr:response regulator [Flavobacteriales bacterium]